jgi:Zn-finger domain-containing protein
VGDVDELRNSIRASRSMLKAAQRTLRSTLQVLSDLEERMEALENAQPQQEAQRNGNHTAGTTAAFEHTIRA